MVHRKAVVSGLLTIALALPLVVQAGQEVLRSSPEQVHDEEFTADLSQVEHGTYEVQHIVVPGPEGNPIALAIQEYDLFAPGEKKVQYADASGAIIREEELLVWTYTGQVIGDPNSHVALTFDTAGMRGAIRTGDLRITFQPEAPNTPMESDLQSPTVARFSGERADAAIEEQEIPCGTLGIYNAAFTCTMGDPPELQLGHHH